MIVACVPETERATFDACSRVCRAWVHARVALFRKALPEPFNIKVLSQLAAVLDASPDLGRHFRHVDVQNEHYTLEASDLLLVLKTMTHVVSVRIAFFNLARGDAELEAALAVPLRSSTLTELTLDGIHLTQRGLLDLTLPLRALKTLNLVWCICEAKAPGWESTIAEADVGAIQLHTLNMRDMACVEEIAEIFTSKVSPFGLQSLKHLDIYATGWPIHKLAPLVGSLEQLSIGADTVLGELNIDPSDWTRPDYPLTSRNDLTRTKNHVPIHEQRDGRRNR